MCLRWNETVVDADAECLGGRFLMMAIDQELQKLMFLRRQAIVGLGRRLELPEQRDVRVLEVHLHLPVQIA